MRFFRDYDIDDVNRGMERRKSTAANTAVVLFSLVQFSASVPLDQRTQSLRHGRMRREQIDEPEEKSALIDCSIHVILYINHRIQMSVNNQHHNRSNTVVIGQALCETVAAEFAGTGCNLSKERNV